MLQTVSESSADLCDWAQLPTELFSKIFTHLFHEDLCRAELCCRSWLQALRCPQVLASGASAALSSLVSSIFAPIKQQCRVVIPPLQSLKLVSGCTAGPRRVERT